MPSLRSPILNALEHVTLWNVDRLRDTVLHCRVLVRVRIEDGKTDTDILNVKPAGFDMTDEEEQLARQTAIDQAINQYGI